MINFIKTYFRKIFHKKHRYVTSGFIKNKDGTFTVRLKCTRCGKVKYK